MAASTRRLHLGAFLFNVGNHIAGWRLAETDTAGLMTLGLYRQLAQTAERGKFDFVFHSDGLGLNDEHAEIIRRTVTVRPEPISLLSALAAVTQRIGLAGTISTSYNEPYHVARKFATLDHLSEGRAAVNIVTSTTTQEAQNFGREAHFDHAERYRRATEFVAVTRALWDSWEDGAIIADKETAVFADPAKVHHLDHRGTDFAVRGPLNVPRPPQGHPVIIQAGASGPGKELAAAVADIIFVVHHGIADARAAYAETKRRVAAAGRDPAAVKILPGMMPILGATEEEARAREAALNELIHPSIAIAYLSDLLGHDLTVYPSHGPLPDIAEGNGQKGRFNLIVDQARAENLSIAEVARRQVINRGHLRFVGTARQIADQIEAWFAEEACDGFNVMPPYHPGGLEAFVDHVVPELQARGLFRRDYEGTTLRDHLGLPRPANGFAP